jgi:hypothetical protein
MKHQSQASFSKKLDSTYEEFRVDRFPKRHFSPEQFHEAIDGIVGTTIRRVNVREAGRSFGGRTIRLFSAGRGKSNVLLWSQMHGDESTATMAVTDILNYLFLTAAEKATSKILSTLSVHFLPVLNPDGAARCARRTAQGIDMNRDALALITPEGKLLRQLQKELRPRFGFNLHDQELSTVGASRTITTIGLLAPAFDERRRDNAVRTRAKLLASVFARAITPAAKGSIARYDDTFEPRAFGDNMQKWGTSTLLVESGHAAGDPEKQLIRKLNFTGILTCLYAIATGEYARARISDYEVLPFNGKKAYETIIRKVLIDDGGGRTMKADLGLSSQVDTHLEPPAKLVDVGDLSTYVGLEEIDGKGKIIPREKIRFGEPFQL